MLKRRKNSNPEKSFEKACAENNIVLKERKGNLEPMRVIDDFGNVKVCFSVEDEQSQEESLNYKMLELACKGMDEKELKELNKEILESIAESTMEPMIITKSAKRRRKNILQKEMKQMSDLIQGIKNQYE